MTTSIQRFQSTRRLSRVVVHNGTVYLAGVVARDTAGDIGVQTADVLAQIDQYRPASARRGTSCSPRRSG
jgi:enamine deaminase RidA (YjgF/YER057c/UK114 family)